MVILKIMFCSGIFQNSQGYYFDYSIQWGIQGDTLWIPHTVYMHLKQII